jgi:hypothetical protein
MSVSFSVAQIDLPSSRGVTDGWAIVRHEEGQPNRYVSRIFLLETEAKLHAQRLTIQEAAKIAKKS